MLVSSICDCQGRQVKYTVKCTALHPTRKQGAKKKLKILYNVEQRLKWCSCHARVRQFHKSKIKHRIITAPNIYSEVLKTNKQTGLQSKTQTECIPWCSQQPCSHRQTTVYHWTLLTLQQGRTSKGEELDIHSMMPFISSIEKFTAQRQAEQDYQRLEGRETGDWGALNENGSNRPTYLNACFPVGRTVWEWLGGVILLELRQWEWTWGFRSLHCS